MKLINFQITIGYRGVITIDVKAIDENEAREKALEVFEKRSFGKGAQIQDDSFRIQGVLNYDETWGIL